VVVEFFQIDLWIIGATAKIKLERLPLSPWLNKRRPILQHFGVSVNKNRHFAGFDPL
jgi:hypothetical protein